MYESEMLIENLITRHKPPSNSKTGPSAVPCTSAKKKRRSEAVEASGRESPPATETLSPEAAITMTTEKTAPAAAGEDGNGGGVDRISGLPDTVLGEIIALLPTKDGARTQVLASRWANRWRSAPLNLDFGRGPLTATADYPGALAATVSRVLSTHQGPCRRFHMPPLDLPGHGATVDAWLRSPALDLLQELELLYFRGRPPVFPEPPPPPVSPAAFRFSATLRVATLGDCHIPDEALLALGEGQSRQTTTRTSRGFFPLLKQLGLAKVRISEGSLQAMLSGCPALECLLLDSCHGFRRVRIRSACLRDMAVRGDYFGHGIRLREVVVEAPCLQSLLIAERVGLHVSVMAAATPKLQTLGCLSDWGLQSRHVFGTTIFRGLHLVSFTTVVRSVKILAVDWIRGSLDKAIDLMTCFPCVEKLYIKCYSLSKPQEENLWRCKHRRLLRFFDMRLKTLVLEGYEGIRAHVRFASSFLLNARELESMTIEVKDTNNNEEFFAKQRTELQLEERASRNARLVFTTHRCRFFLMHIKHVQDLTINDPFVCTC